MSKRRSTLRAAAFVWALATALIMNTGCAETRVGGMSARDAFSDERVARLVTAGDNEDFKGMDTAIHDGADVNAVGKDGISPLMWLLTNRHLKSAERLLQAGANPNYKEPKDNYSAIAVAAGGSYPEMLELLLKYGGDPNARGLEHNDPLLIIAVMHFRDANIDLLLKYGADINIHRADGDTAANVAVGLGRFDLAAKFLERGLTHNLLNLAKDAEISQVRPNSEAQRWKDKVIEMLKERGIKFPAFKPRRSEDD